MLNISDHDTAKSITHLLLCSTILTLHSAIPSYN